MQQEGLTKLPEDASAAKGVTTLDIKDNGGYDIKTVQYGYPVGMPLTRVLKGTNLEEVRCKISNGIARIIFCVEDNTIVLLHAFIKKTQKTPQKELDVAIKRYKELCKR